MSGFVWEKDCYTHRNANEKKSVNTSEFSQYICEMGRGSDIYFSMVIAMIKLVNTCDVCVSF